MNKNLFFLALVGFLVAGCNTVEGVGKDVKGAGGALEESAERHKP